MELRKVVVMGRVVVGSEKACQLDPSERMGRGSTQWLWVKAPYASCNVT